MMLIIISWIVLIQVRESIARDTIQQFNACIERLNGSFPPPDRFLESPVFLCFSRFSLWCHQMETFSALLALCAGNSPVTGEFPSQRPVTRSFDVFFDLCLNNSWVNNRDADDLRRRRAHYDVTVMSWCQLCHYWRHQRSSVTSDSKAGVTITQIFVGNCNF